MIAAGGGASPGRAAGWAAEREQERVAGRGRARGIGARQGLDGGRRSRVGVWMTADPGCRRSRPPARARARGRGSRESRRAASSRDGRRPGRPSSRTGREQDDARLVDRDGHRDLRPCQRHDRTERQAIGHEREVRAPARPVRRDRGHHRGAREDRLPVPVPALARDVERRPAGRRAGRGGRAVPAASRRGGAAPAAAAVGRPASPRSCAAARHGRTPPSRRRRGLRPDDRGEVVRPRDGLAVDGDDDVAARAGQGSPACRPAAAAGPPGVTSPICAPGVPGVLQVETPR